MAAILQSVLERQISPEDVVKWILSNHTKEKPPSAVEEFQGIKSEFPPFLLNYLRDQTMNLLQGCSSASPSPAKTPSSVQKLKRKSTVDSPNASIVTTTTSTPLPRQGSTNRIRLFMNSPLDPLTPAGDSFRKKGKPSPNPMTSVSLNFDSPAYSDSSGNTSGSSVFKKDSFMDSSLEARFHKGDNSYNTSLSFTESFLNRTPGNKQNARNDITQRNSPWQTPETIRHHKQSSSDNSRSKHRHSFGEFLATPDFEIRRKMSPHLRQDGESGRKLGHKNRKARDLKHNQPEKDTSDTSTGFTLSNVDEFPPVGAAQPKPKSRALPGNVKVITPSRRITPTPLSGQGSVQVANSIFEPLIEASEPAAVFSSVSTELQSPTKNMEQERQKLREEREKIGQKKEVSININTPVKVAESNSLCTPTKTPSKASLERLLSTEVIRADPDMVTYKEELQLIADLYSACLQYHLVPNMTVEMYFLVQLLTARGSDMGLVSFFPQSAEGSDTNFFSSIHNAVYFAVVVLSQQDKLLSMLDKATVKLLADNNNLGDFNSALKNKLLELHKTLSAKASSVRSHSPIGGVSFQADTDNRKNFPSDRAFHLFRKQRDQFYEMLREWEEEHLSQGWNMVEVMGDRIRSLISCKLDLANHIHFTRLFQAQLLQMCRSDQQVKSEGEEDEHLLSQLKQANPEKFKRLQERFITPQTSGGPSPPPSFPGCQEFFRDFIQAAASPVFNQHLSNTMTSSIDEVSSTQFIAIEVEKNEDGHIDQEDRELLTKSLVTLRILGKFLGFVTFLPYQTPEVLPDSMQAEYINMRNKTSLVVDIVGCLKSAEHEGRLVVTVPWLVEFLSMMDPTAPQLQPFHAIFLQLLHVFRVASQCFMITGSLSFLMVTLVLGWLFELPIFPEELFFNHIGEKVTVIFSPKCLDELDMVDHALLYSCCPYLGEIRSLLLGSAVGSSNRGSTIRKITPLSTTVETLSSVTEKQIEHQLEEHFFHNLPASHKRTVDFVADRVASNHIKQFRGTTLPRLVQEGQATVAQQVSQVITDGSPDAKAKKKLMSEVEDFAVKLAEQGRQEANDQAKSYCSSRAAEILRLLLPEETTEVVLDMSCQICNRYALDKVNSWLTMHITKAVFTKDLNNEMEKRLKVAEKKAEKCEKPAEERETGQSEEHTTETPPTVSVLPAQDCITSLSPSEVVIEFKEVLRQLLLGEETYGATDIITLLKAIKHTMKDQTDLMAGVPKIFAKLSVDAAYSIVLLHPGLWSENLQNAFLDVWTNDLRSQAAFSRSVCIKHILMIHISKDTKSAWKKLGMLMHSLLQHHLVAVGDLEAGFMDLLHHNHHLTQVYLEELLLLACSVSQSYHLTRQHRTGSEFINILQNLQCLTQDQPSLVSRIQETLRLIQCLNSNDQSESTATLQETQGTESRISATSQSLCEQLELTTVKALHSRDSSTISNNPSTLSEHIKASISISHHDTLSSVLEECSLEKNCEKIANTSHVHTPESPLLDITSDIENTSNSTAKDKSLHVKLLSNNNIQH